MIYKVKLTDNANEQFRDLPPSCFQEVMNELTQLSVYPKPPKAEKLKTRNAFRIRVSNYRFVYFIDEKINVVNVLHIKESAE